MENFDDTVDPLDLAFAHPKAGKKLKPGEVLPGMEGVSFSSASIDSRPFSIIDETPVVADPALSQALDDAFSNPNFGVDPQKKPTQEPVYAEDTAIIEARLARDIDDAFANPKVGNRIEEGSDLASLGLSASLHDGPRLETPRLDDIKYDQIPSKSGGLFGPKLLVIAMILGVIIAAVVVGSSQPESLVSGTKPTLIQMD